MKKSNWTLFIFVLVGLLAGSVIGNLLSSVDAVAFLVKSTEISWHPKADLQVVNYDLLFKVKLNLLSIVGVIAAVWIYRKL